MSEEKIVRVKDVMTKDFDFIDGMDTVGNVLRNMTHSEARALIVRKRDDDDEYGMLLISDIARKVLAQDKPPDRVNVYEIMAKPVIMVYPDMQIKYCARLLDRFGLTRVPVVELGEVVGIVSFGDLVLRGFRDHQL